MWAHTYRAALVRAKDEEESAPLAAAARRKLYVDLNWTPASSRPQPTTHPLSYCPGYWGGHSRLRWPGAGGGAGEAAVKALSPAFQARTSRRERALVTLGGKERAALHTLGAQHPGVHPTQHWHTTQTHALAQALVQAAAGTAGTPRAPVLSRGIARAARQGAFPCRACAVAACLAGVLLPPWKP
jgi:hypothetical protein